MSSTKKVLWVGGGIIVFILLLIGAQHANSGYNPTANLNVKISPATCSFPQNAATATYSVTLVAQNNNFEIVSNNAEALVAKYHGELSSYSESVNETQTGPGPNSYVNVTSTYFTATIPVEQLAGFMSDINNLGAFVETPNYSETAYSQMTQNCMDDITAAEEQISIAKTYSDGLSGAFNHYTPAPAAASYPNSSASNIDDMNTNLQNAYNQLAADEDNISNILQNVNRATVSITINDGNVPTAYYPMAPEPIPAEPTND